MIPGARGQTPEPSSSLADLVRPSKGTVFKPQGQTQLRGLHGDYSSKLGQRPMITALFNVLGPTQGDSSEGLDFVFVQHENKIVSVMKQIFSSITSTLSPH